MRVCFTSRNRTSIQAVSSDAMCQEETYAPQQIASLFDDPVDPAE